MTLLMELWKYVLVFLLGATPWVEIGVVIPVSIAAGMNPVTVSVLAFLGNLSTVYLLALFFEKCREWLERRRGGKKGRSKRGERAVAVWNKYGMPGLALLGPLLIGSHIAVFIGILLGANRRAMVLWMTASLVGWTVAIAIVSVLGIDLLDRTGG